MRHLRLGRLAAGVLAGIVLATGTLVYVLDRPPELTPFFAPVSLSGRVPVVFGAIGQYLPTFAHVFSFSVLTALLLADRPRGALAACSSWFMLDSAFEAGQHPAVAAHVRDWLPDSIRSAGILRPIGDYFSGGTFDPLDLLSIAIGALTAYGLLLRVADDQRSDA